MAMGNTIGHLHKNEGSILSHFFNPHFHIEGKSFRGNWCNIFFFIFHEVYDHDIVWSERWNRKKSSLTYREPPTRREEEKLQMQPALWKRNIKIWDVNSNLNHAYKL